MTALVDSQSETATRSLTLIEAVREALRQEMERDERVVVLGEDVGPLGGVFRATDGLLAQFGPQRVIDTPMMELGIAGLAVGMAMRGLRPVAEIQFADFMHAAADHIISDAARIRFRTNGDAQCPLVIRTAYGGGLRGGPYHSQSVEAYYAHVPGLRVVAASFPADAKGLLIAAIRHPDPVLFLEHKRTYRSIRGDVPGDDYELSLDRASIVRPGSHVTVVSWGWVLHETLAATEQLAIEGIEVEVIDPRSLNPLDTETILESVRRTGRLCVVHEDTRTMGVGAELAALACEHALDDLRAPVERLAMPDVAGIPASGPMEDFLIPDRARIAASLRTLAAIDRGQRTILTVNGRTPLPPAVATQLPATAAGPEAASASVAGPEAPAAFASAAQLPATAAGPEAASASVAGPEAPAAFASAGSAASVSAREILPQASSVVEIDLSRVARRLEADREAWQLRGIEPSFTPFFAEALLAALRQVPQANAAFDAEARGIRRYPAVHLGLSVASVDGSSACHRVVRDADTRNVLGLAMEIGAARSAGNVDAQVLTEATITLADYGAASSALFAVPVVLRGQVAAIRIGAVEERLVVRERGFALAPTAYVCASIDHRALDGMDAGALLTAMKRSLEED
jgi:2-oxoisovalerate dehydrogenase E1 component beta subunit